MKLRVMTALLALGTTTGVVAEQVSFVTCPIYRDTNYHNVDPSHHGRRTGCWLADNPETGIRYEVNESWSKPDWNYAVLVEGAVKEDAPDVCGGVTLEPVFTTVLYDRKCPRHSLQAEGYSGRPPTFSPRYVMPIGFERKLPPKPYKTTTFSPVFDFDSSFMIWNYSDYVLDLAIYFIREANPSKIVVTGWAATNEIEVTGVRLKERPEVAKERADIVVENLLRMGVPEDLIEVHVRTKSKPADVELAGGLVEPSRRRVDIEVVVD